MFKKIAVFVIALFAGMAFAACTSLHSDNDSVAQPATVETPAKDMVKVSPSDIAGIYEYKDGQVEFKADVDDNTISVKLTLDGSTGVYWVGDRDTVVLESKDALITSQADTEALSASLFGSQDTAKVFHYTSDGTFSFKFTMMGVTKDVVLKRV